MDKKSGKPKEPHITVEEEEEKKSSVQVDYTGPLTVFGEEGQRNVNNSLDEQQKKKTPKRQSSKSKERPKGELDMKQLSLNEIMMVACSSHTSNDSGSYKHGAGGHGSEQARADPVTAASSTGTGERMIARNSSEIQPMGGAVMMSTSLSSITAGPLG